MTLGDVRREVLNLGFETKESYEEEPSIFTDAINRALREITGVFPLVGRYEIAQHPLRNLLPSPVSCFETRHYDGKTPLIYRAQNARAFTFECSGKGTVEISDQNGVRVVALESKQAFTEYKQFVQGSLTLTFSGMYAYDVKNIAVYGEQYSDDLADIPPWRKYIRYDLKELTKENDTVVFLEMLDRIEESDGMPYQNLQDFQIEARHVLVLDGTQTAQFTVFYRKNFVPFAVDTPDETNVSLDADREHLLPLLTAWYVWADDEPDKAAKWRNDYEDFKARMIGEQEKPLAQEVIENVTGW